MTDLKNDYTDGDYLRPGAVTDTDKLNGITFQVDTNTVRVDNVLDMQMVTLDYAQKNSWVAPDVARFPRKTAADIATDSNGYLNTLSLSNCAFISQYVNNGALSGPVIVPNTVSLTNDQTDAFAAVTAWDVTLTGDGVFQSTGGQLEVGCLGGSAGTYSGVIQTARTVSSSNLVQFSIEKEVDFGGGGNTLNVQLRESGTGTVLSRMEQQASGADKYQFYIGSIVNGTDVTVANNAVVKVRASFVSSTVLFIEWLVDSTVVFAGFKTTTTLALKFGIVGSRAAGADSMKFDNFSADHATSFTAATVTTSALSSSTLESTNVDQVYAVVQPFVQYDSPNTQITYDASSDNGSTYTTSLSLSTLNTISSTLGKELILRFNLGGTGNNKYLFKGYAVNWSNA